VDRAPDHHDELFTLEELQMLKQFVLDEAPEHGLFEDELQMFRRFDQGDVQIPRQSVQASVLAASRTMCMSMGYSLGYSRMNSKCLGNYFQDKVTELGLLFALDELQMHRQFVRDEASEHGLFKDELQIQYQSNSSKTVRVSCGEHGLFEDELQMPRLFIQEKVHEHGIFKDDLQFPRQFVQDEAPERRLFLLDELQIHRQFVQDSRTKRVSIGC
jgi:hypothetical protein